MSGRCDVRCCDCGRLVGRTAYTGPMPSISCEECSDREADANEGDGE